MCAPRTRRRSRSAAAQTKAKRGASRRFEGSAAAAAHARLSRAQVLRGTRGRGRPRGASGGMGRSGRTAQCGATLSTTSRCSCGETNKQTNSAPFARARRTSHAPALSKHAARAQWAPHGSAARPAPLRCWHAHVHTAAAHLRTQRRRFVRLHARTPAHSRAGCQLPSYRVARDTSYWCAATRTIASANSHSRSSALPCALWYGAAELPASLLQRKRRSCRSAAARRIR